MSDPVFFGQCVESGPHVPCPRGDGTFVCSECGQVSESPKITVGELDGQIVKAKSLVDIIHTVDGAREAAVTDFVTKEPREYVLTRVEKAENIENVCYQTLGSLLSLMKGSLKVFNEDTEQITQLVPMSPETGGPLIRLRAATNRLKELVTTLDAVNQSIENHQKRMCR